MNHHLYRDFPPSWKRKPRAHPVVWLMLAATLGVTGGAVLLTTVALIGVEWVR